MTEDKEAKPNPWQWVVDQVREYEASGGTRANTLRDTGIPIIVMTTVGHKTGEIRKVPVMRVEKDGEYAIIASKGGYPSHPGWYHNLVANPNVTIQDGPEPHPYEVRLLEGDERTEWFERGAAIFAPYREYEAKAAEHDREIPVFLASRVS